MRAVALSLPPHACPRRDRRRPIPSSFLPRQRYKHASVVERPPQSDGQRLELVEGASARGLTCHCADEAVNVWLQSRSLPARGRVDLEVHRCLCIIDAGNVFISTDVHRSRIYLLFPRCTSAVSFFSCCGSVAALALANCNWHVADGNISRPHTPTSSVLCTVPKLE